MSVCPINVNEKKKERKHFKKQTRCPENYQKKMQKEKKNYACNINIKQSFEFKHTNLYIVLVHRMWVKFHLNIVTIGLGFAYLLVFNDGGHLVGVSVYLFAWVFNFTHLLVLEYQDSKNSPGTNVSKRKIMKWLRMDSPRFSHIRRWCYSEFCDSAAYSSLLC